MKHAVDDKLLERIATLLADTGVPEEVELQAILAGPERELFVVPQLEWIPHETRPWILYSTKSGYSIESHPDGKWHILYRGKAPLDGNADIEVIKASANLRNKTRLKQDLKQV